MLLTLFRFSFSTPLLICFLYFFHSVIYAHKKRYKLYAKIAQSLYLFALFFFILLFTKHIVCVCVYSPKHYSHHFFVPLFFCFVYFTFKTFHCQEICSFLSVLILLFRLNFYRVAYQHLGGDNYNLV